MSLLGTVYNRGRFTIGQRAASGGRRYLLCGLGALQCTDHLLHAPPPGLLLVVVAVQRLAVVSLLGLQLLVERIHLPLRRTWQAVRSSLLLQLLDLSSGGRKSAFRWVSCAWT